MTIDILAQIFREQLGDAYLDAAVADAKRHDIAALENPQTTQPTANTAAIPSTTSAGSKLPSGGDE